MKYDRSPDDFDPRRWRGVEVERAYLFGGQDLFRLHHTGATVKARAGCIRDDRRSVGVGIPIALGVIIVAGGDRIGDRRLPALNIRRSLFPRRVQQERGALPARPPEAAGSWKQFPVASHTPQRAAGCAAAPCRRTGDSSNRPPPCEGIVRGKLPVPGLPGSSWTRRSRRVPLGV